MQRNKEEGYRYYSIDIIIYYYLLSTPIPYHFPFPLENLLTGIFGGCRESDPLSTDLVWAGQAQSFLGGCCCFQHPAPGQPLPGIGDLRAGRAHLALGKVRWLPLWPSGSTLARPGPRAAIFMKTEYGRFLRGFPYEVTHRNLVAILEGDGDSVTRFNRGGRNEVTHHNLVAIL